MDQEHQNTELGSSKISIKAIEMGAVYLQPDGGSFATLTSGRKKPQPRMEDGRSVNTNIINSIVYVRPHQQYGGFSPSLVKRI